jgi:hypothetical protein
VGFCACLAVLCVDKHSDDAEVPVQYGLVGVHFPSGGIGNLYWSYCGGFGERFLQNLDNGEYFMFVSLRSLRKYDANLLYVGHVTICGAPLAFSCWEDGIQGIYWGDLLCSLPSAVEEEARRKRLRKESVRFI